ncbi:MAG: topoisomerase, partial [Patescibacteria group bacterium]|nr:topoisomerase [Patescibacteria group bacterium]
EAHEAVRVTDIKLTGDHVEGSAAKMTAMHAKLYDLIWRRSVASQMPEARYDQTTLLIQAKPATAGDVKSVTLRSSGSVLKFDGWMKLFKASEDVLLPDVQKGEAVHYLDHNAAQKFTQPPPRYNDASLVKELEKRGIGRPSTYASIISVIEDRGYVSRDAKRFVASPVGMTVSDFLKEHFPVFMEYEFTAEMEEDLDRISRGEKQWQKVVSEFYKPFEKKLKDADSADRTQIPVEETGDMCPTCGATDGGKVVIRSGRFGKFKSCNRYPDCDFKENIVEKVEGVVCPLCQQGEVIVKNSRWGKSFFGCSRYPDCEWANWKAPQPGEVVTADEWAEIKARREERKAKRAAAQAGQEADYARSNAKSAGATKAKTSKKSAAKKPRKKATKK